jgi:hypothetical protein
VAVSDYSLVSELREDLNKLQEPKQVDLITEMKSHNENEKGQIRCEHCVLSGLSPVLCGTLLTAALHTQKPVSYHC